jgi:hypothetical protein
VLAFQGQHAFALGMVIALAEPRPDLGVRWPSRLVATASGTPAGLCTRRLRQPVIAKERDFTSHALRFPVDGMPRFDRISAPIVLSKPECSNSFDHLIRAQHEPGAGYRIDGDQSAGCAATSAQV